VHNAIRALREHLDYIQKHKRKNGLRNGHRERNHNICGDWAIGSIWEKEYPSKPSYMEKSARRLTSKSFILHNFSEIYGL
jgi:hypothetical protein